MELNRTIKEENKRDNTDDSEILTTVIRRRRSIYADEFITKEIPDIVLREILTNAIWAPNHKMTEPWRFIVLKGKYLKEYGEYMANYYRDIYLSKFSSEILEEKLNDLRNYPLNAACLIGIILVKNKKINLPEWEEIAAISSAVQNIALSCTSYNIGSYWSTKSVAVDYISEFDLKENERSLGLLYLGYYPNDLKPSNKKRTSLDKKVIYLE